MGEEHKGGKQLHWEKWDDFEIMTTYSNWISFMMFLNSRVGRTGGVGFGPVKPWRRGEVR